MVFKTANDKMSEKKTKGGYIMQLHKNYPSEAFEDLRRLYHTCTEKFKDRILFRQKGNGEYRDVTYRKYAEDVDAIGTELCARGLGGKHIMILGENCYEWVLSYLAVVCGVGVAVPANKDASAEQIAHVAASADVDAVIYSEECEGKLSALPASAVRIPFSALCEMAHAGNDRIIAGDRGYIDSVIDPDEMRVLIFTAGSTGEAKGVMLSHRNICAGLCEVASMIHVDREDRFLSVLPLHYTYECTCGFLLPMYRGATVIFAEGVRHIARSMRETQPTVFLSVPLLIETLYEKFWENIEKHGDGKSVRRAIAVTNTLLGETTRTKAKRRALGRVLRIFGGKLRMVITAGYAADAKVLKGWRDLGIHVLHGYALTECTPLAALNRDNVFNDASVGLAFPNTLLDVYDVQNDGTGEIRFKGENLMLGYYKNEELTREVVRGGWFYTGDLGYIDKHGFLFILGRKKNMLVTADRKNVYPEELEELLCKATYVKEAVVVGYPNEEHTGDNVVAVIHPDYERIIDTYGKNFAVSQLDLEMKKAISEVNGRVAPHKRISAYVIRREEFPKNSSRKIIRAGIADEAHADYLAKRNHK